MSEPQIWADGTAGTVIGCDTWNSGTVMACDWSGGRILAFGVADGHLDLWGDGYSSPEGIAVFGDEALITEQTGTLLRQNLLSPGRGGATVLASGLGAPHQVVLSADHSSSFLTDYAGGRLLRVDIASGAVDVVAVGLGNPVGIALDADGGFYVTTQAPAALVRIASDGTRTTVLAGLVSPFFLGWADDERTSLLMTERAPVHRVSFVDLTAPVPAATRIIGRSITEPSAALVTESRLVITATDRVISLDATGGLAPAIRVGVPDEPLWPGGWHDAEIDTGVTGYTRDELSIEVEPAGIASLSAHPSVAADPARPTIRILAGGGLGAAEIVVRDAATTAELGRTALSVDTVALGVDGPPMWIEGPSAAPTLPRTLSLTRGVNDFGDLTPKDTAGARLPNWRVVAVLVDTGSAAWPTTAGPGVSAPTAATAQADWATVMSDLDTFYSEMSRGQLGIEMVGAAVHGPVSVGKSWSDWFVRGADGTWAFKDELLGAVVGNMQGQGIDWTAVDCVFMIVRSPGGDQFAWPFARGKVLPYKVKQGKGDVDILLSMVSMPHDQTTVVGFTDAEVSSHEVGHTLGLDDLYMDTGYSDSMKKRDLGRRELMAHEDDLAALCARHQLLLGFLGVGNVATFSYDVDANRSVDLHPLSDGAAPGANTYAIELKVAPRVSWFFEFRQAVAGKVGDQSTFGTGQIMGYDAWTYKNPPIVADARRPIILLLDDGDGEDAVITAGQDYEVLDTENPVASRQFRLDVVSIGPGGAKVNVTVSKVDQPDPAIRNNPGNGDYKSPDIEVRNEVSDKDAAFLNRPIIGINNRVVAKVTNIGGLPAPGVTVRFKTLPFNTDDPESERWTNLGEPVTHDIPAGATVEFETDWLPNANRHTCIQARIDRYTRIPGAAADEPDVDNNLAQSNYFEIFSKPSSPATREVAFVDVHNPFDHPVRAGIELRQDVRGYRSYIEHRSVFLTPGQTRSVRVEVESKATSIWDALERHQPDGRTWLRSWLYDPERGHSARTGAGVTVSVATAVQTQLDIVERGGRVTFVRVSSPAGGPPPSEGSVVMQVRYDDGVTDVLQAPVDGSGFTRFDTRDDIGGDAVARFSGCPGYAPSVEELRLPGDR